MIYRPPVGSAEVLAVCTYGSHLYGTNSETSDYDFKAITLPNYRDLLLAHKPKVERFRFDVHGNTLSDHETMPANGWEAEHTPVQKFAQDFLGGQTYAIEFAFAFLQGFSKEHIVTNSDKVRSFDMYTLVHALVHDFKHQNVQGMVGFAVKQTLDYVHRGERLNTARALLSALDLVLDSFAGMSNEAVRLDSIMPRTKTTVLSFLADTCALKISKSENNGRTLLTLELNGRSYLETTAVTHLHGAVSKLISKYGVRSTAASESDVDWKSLSHAVRVYQQVLEYLSTGWITFPRPNAEYLLKIKQGLETAEVVRELLVDLDADVKDAMEVTKLPKVDSAMNTALDNLLFTWLNNLYSERVMKGHHVD